MSQNKKYTDIYIIRHGLPDYIHDSLTEEGFVEAEETSKILCKIPFDLIFASSQGRAVATAKPTAEKLNLPITTLDWATENKAASFMQAKTNDDKFTWCFFVEEFLAKAYELKNDPNWYDDPFFDARYKQGIKFYEEEIDKWLLSMNLKHNRETGIYESVGETPNNVALFAHGGMATQTIPSILDLNYAAYVTSFAHLDTCAYTQIRIWHNGRAYLLKHNVKPIEIKTSFNKMEN